MHGMHAFSACHSAYVHVDNVKVQRHKVPGCTTSALYANIFVLEAAAFCIGHLARAQVHITDRLLMDSTQKHPRCAVLTCAVTRSCIYLLLAMQGLGADKCVDYKKENFEELYADDPFDVILDLIGGGLY